ncbi:hypothetical protein PIB30_099313 [Stylosanthes scabra]|uniref:Uncharacterized protein n=1 Tax=Stylosanthes scabra TaxID=79078 RepID=A0ABU6VXP6_9FABA|nr:hypothetical protein [Stylosanthes scabra]
MFDTFETVSLGGDDSGNVAVEGPVVVPSHPSHNEKEVLKAESKQHEKTNDAEVEGEDAAMEGKDAAVEVPPNMENVVQEELQPEPLVVIMPIQPERPSESRVAELEVPPRIVDNVVHEKIQHEPLVVIMKWMELIEVAALSAAHTFKLPYNIEEWSQDQLDQFRKDIVAKLIMSKENTLNVEAIKQASNMTLEAITEAREKMGQKPKPSAALKSPYAQVSTTELEKKH